MNEVAAVVFIASCDYPEGVDVGSSRPETSVRAVSGARVWTNPGREFAIGAAQESMERIVRIRVNLPITAPSRLIARGVEPYPPEPGTSNFVNFPFGLRTNPWLKPFAS